MAKELEAQYAEYNTKYFRGKLPLVPVRWRKNLRLDGDRCYGVTWFHQPNTTYVARCIQIHSELKNHLLLWQLTLLHEAVHVSIGHQEDAHGEKFQKEMMRLAIEGAFESLW